MVSPWFCSIVGLTTRPFSYLGFWLDIYSGESLTSHSGWIYTMQNVPASIQLMLLTVGSLQSLTYRHISFLLSDTSMKCLAGFSLSNVFCTVLNFLTTDTYILYTLYTDRYSYLTITKSSLPKLDLDSVSLTTRPFSYLTFWLAIYSGVSPFIHTTDGSIYICGFWAQY